MTITHLPEAPAPAEETTGGKPKPPPMIERLIEFAHDYFEVFRAPDGRIYGVRRGDPRQALAHGKPSGLVNEIKRMFFAAHQKWPDSGSAAGLADFLEVHAEDVRQVPIRSWWDGHRLLLDLGDQDETILAIDGRGVREEPDPGVSFRRSPNTAAIPLQNVPGDLDKLWKLVPVVGADQRIVLALLVFAWFTGVPQPIVLLTGPQDSGKTTAARFLLSLVDPVTHQRGGSLPQREDEWKARVSQGRVVFVDNTSHITPAVSDMLCRVATGGEMTSRLLYTNDGAHVTDLLVPVWLTSIDSGVLRGDLQSRIVPIELEALRIENRRADSELKGAQDEARPAITRGLLDLASQVIGMLPNVDRKGLTHRMTDFELVLRCIDQILGAQEGLPTGTTRLAERSRDLAGDVLDADPVAIALLAAIRDEEKNRARGHSRGVLGSQTAVDLLTALNNSAALSLDGGLRAKEWPRTPKVLTERLKRIAPALLDVHDVAITFRRTKSQRLITIARKGADLT